MKIVLTILCGLMALFGGGCALMIANGAGTITLLPLAILIFNALILFALWGWKTPWRPAFYILGIIDLLIAAGFAIAVAASGRDAQYIAVPFLMAAAVFALKGALTLIYAQKV